MFQGEDSRISAPRAVPEEDSQHGDHSRGAIPRTNTGYKRKLKLQNLDYYPISAKYFVTLCEKPDAKFYPIPFFSDSIIIQNTTLSYLRLVLRNQSHPVTLTNVRIKPGRNVINICNPLFVRFIQENPLSIGTISLIYDLKKISCKTGQMFHFRKKSEFSSTVLAPSNQSTSLTSYPVILSLRNQNLYSYNVTPINLSVKKIIINPGIRVNNSTLFPCSHTENESLVLHC
jgi:hypothetical protein